VADGSVIKPPIIAKYAGAEREVLSLFFLSFHSYNIYSKSEVKSEKEREPEKTFL
jgi:hypothetical protein